ncbi:hypothetical protein JQN72_07770 [Phycicoccus sp. CSK15P-2]|uniref:hypothetical protein n=1 Tax=Phycicoccus sp. CSK15P-2 TaxID=2807627 RepID=UPI001950BC1A|nr:hypothetical protein [Phycicoccus sp. CSK15P-2]MBM6404140.1 hypothetical protein [Phycicoccus sp. CSK15P-2]
MLRPVSGSGEGLRRLADALETTGRRLADTAGTLVFLRDRAVWEGEAQRLFLSRIADAPTLLGRATRRFEGAAGPLRRFAAVLEEEQRLATWLSTRHSSACDEILAIENRIVALLDSGREMGDPQVETLLRLQRDEVAVMTESEARHAAAHARVEEADAECARALRALAEDDIADSFFYRGTRTVSGIGHGLGYVGVVGQWSPHARVAGAVGDTVGLGGDAVLAVFYDEGDWAQIGSDVGMAATGVFGDGLRAGAKLGATTKADGTVVSAAMRLDDRVVGGSIRAAKDRLREARDSHRLNPPRQESDVQRRPLPQRPTVGDRVSREADYRRRQMAHEYRLVSAGGSSTQKMYVAGASLSAAVKARETTQKVDETAGLVDRPLRPTTTGGLEDGRAEPTGPDPRMSPGGPPGGR